MIACNTFLTCRSKCKISTISNLKPLKKKKHVFCEHKLRQICIHLETLHSQTYHRLVPTNHPLYYSLCVPSDWKQSQPVWARENCAAVRPQLGLGAPHTVIAGDHLRAGVALGELQRQRRQPGDGRLGTLLQRDQPRGDEQLLQQPQLQAGVLRPGRRRAQRVLPSGRRRDAEPTTAQSLRPRLHPALLHLGGPHWGPAFVPSSRFLTAPSQRASTFQTEPHLPYFLEATREKKRLLQWWKCASASDLPQDFVWMSNIIFYCQFFFNNSTCLCLALSVLNQSSPIMNVKQAEKKEEMSTSTVTHFSLYLISLHWSKRGILEPLWVFIIYLHPQLLYIYYYLLFLHELGCSIFSNSGDKVIIIHHV